MKTASALARKKVLRRTRERRNLNILNWRIEVIHDRNRAGTRLLVDILEEILLGAGRGEDDHAEIDQEHDRIWDVSMHQFLRMWVGTGRSRIS